MHASSPLGSLTLLSPRLVMRSTLNSQALLLRRNGRTWWSPRTPPPPVLSPALSSLGLSSALPGGVVAVFLVVLGMGISLRCRSATAKRTRGVRKRFGRWAASGVLSKIAKVRCEPMRACGKKKTPDAEEPLVLFVSSLFRKMYTCRRRGSIFGWAILNKPINHGCTEDLVCRYCCMYHLISQLGNDIVSLYCTKTHRKTARETGNCIVVFENYYVAAKKTIKSRVRTTRKKKR